MLILVVDDEDALRRFVRRRLVREGHNVMEACGVRGPSVAVP
jgi:DNA-binding response OmpR family regulator